MKNVSTCRGKTHGTARSGAAVFMSHLPLAAGGSEFQLGESTGGGCILKFPGVSQTAAFSEKYLNSSELENILSFCEPK